MKLSDYVVQFVADLGVKHVFVITGGGAMHLNDSLARCRSLEFICNHHEQACAVGATLHAMASGGMGAAMVTTGPGGTNAITGLAAAWLDSVPVLFLSGQVKRADRMFAADGTPLGVRQRGPQEVDIVSVVKPLTKYAVTVTDPASIRYHLEKASYLARNGRQGPVWIDIPIDVQASAIDPNTMTGFVPEEPEADSAQLREQVRSLIERFNRAERPFLWIGNGVRLAHAENEVRELASLMNCPVGTTWVSMDMFGEENALCMGRPGTLAPRGANFALQNSDFLLVIGVRMDPAVSGWNRQELARGAYRAMVDIDAAELGKLSDTIHLPICADAGAFLRKILAQKASIVARDRRQWNTRCLDWKKRYPIIGPEHRQKGRVSIYHLAEVLAEAAGPEDQFISGSSGVGIEIFLFAFPASTGKRVFHSAGLGAMGFGIASSIGVSLAKGHGPVICVDGDGGFQFNIQELATVAHHKLPVKFFVLDNDGYAAIRGSQKNFFGEVNIGCDPATGLSVPDFTEVARAYGIASARIDDQADLLGQVRKVLAMPGPVVCVVKVLPDEPRAPRVTSVQLPNGSFASKPLEDLWPFLDREEFRKNMIVPPLSE